MVLVVTNNPCNHCFTVSDQKDTTRGTSTNTKFAKQSILRKPPKVGTTHALSKPVTSNSIPILQESKVVKNDKVIALGMFRINPFKPSREEKYVPNKVTASVRTNPITVSQPHVITKKVVNSDSNGLSSTGKQKANVLINKNQKKQKSKVKKPKKVGFIERLASPKLSKPRSFLRWSPTGRLFDLKGKIIASSKSESQSECSKGDNACTSNPLEPTIKRFPNFTFSLAGYPNMFMVRRLGLFQAHDRKSKASHQFRLEVLGTVHFGNDHVAAILGFGDLQWGNILITRVYFVEGLRHNLFSVRQFYDSDLDVAFRRNACFVINLEGVDLLSGNRTTNLYTINLHEMASASPICLRALSSVRTPQQNGVVERRNQTLVEAARTMLIFSRAPLFLWAEAIATACFTQNRSIIHRHFNKTPYELINGKKPNISFLHVFGALYYLKNDHEDIGKLGAKGDIGFFIGYSADSCAYRVYNRMSKKITETMNMTFDELSAMAFEQRNIAPIPSNSSSQATNFPNSSQDVDGLKTQPQHAQQQGNQAPIQLETVADNVLNAMFDANTFVNPFATPSTSFIDADHPSYVYKLKKALYGLKQAPRARYDELSLFLLQTHFFKGTIDPTLFIRRFDNDILVPLRNAADGEMTFFLGLQVNQSPCGVFINQSIYVLEILKKYGMESCDPIGTPMEIRDKLNLDQNRTPVDATKYHSMIGAILYLTSSRPDIVHATCLCARYQAKPTDI
nr:copia protein [Tanacetum cinerariifolium]